MPHTPHSTPAAPDADDSPVDIVLRWRRGQVAFVSTLFPGGMLAADGTHDLSTAHAAACTTDPALAAALRGEHRRALGVARALGAVAGDADGLDGLDDALIELLVARAVTRRALRAVLVRDYDCAGCCAEAGEPCFPNCLPTERNTVHPADLTELLD